MVSSHKGEVCAVSIGYWCKHGNSGEPYESKLLFIKRITVQFGGLVIHVEELASEGLSDVNQWSI